MLDNYRVVTLAPCCAPAILYMVWLRSRVFILGPSHHYYTRRCCLSPASSYDTPLGVLLPPINACVQYDKHRSHLSVPMQPNFVIAGSVSIAQDVYQELQSTGQFDVMDIDVDEVSLYAEQADNTLQQSDCPLTCSRRYGVFDCRQSTVWSCRWLTLRTS